MRSLCNQHTICVCVCVEVCGGGGVVGVGVGVGWRCLLHRVHSDQLLPRVSDGYESFPWKSFHLRGADDSALWQAHLI